MSNPTPLTTYSPASSGQMSRRRKAAVIVQLLINDGNKLSLSAMPESVQTALAEEMGEIRLVDRDTVNAVAEEFADLLESIGLSAPGDARSALAALSGHISPALARRLQAQLDSERVDDPWSRVLSLDLERLVPIFHAESHEVGAILLSKLSVDRAAEVLGQLPGDMARRITFAVNQTEKTDPETMERIGDALVQEYCQASITVFDKPPVARIGAILNYSQAKTRDDVLTGLEDDDADLAKSVRKAIFIFENIPDRMSPTDIPNVLRGIEPEDLNAALGYALAAGGELENAAEHILANISQRMAGQMREDVNELGTISQKVGEAAMNKVTATIRTMAEAGTIKLRNPDEEDEEAA